MLLVNQRAQTYINSLGFGLSSLNKIEFVFLETTNLSGFWVGILTTRIGYELSEPPPIDMGLPSITLAPKSFYRTGWFLFVSLGIAPWFNTKASQTNNFLLFCRDLDINGGKNSVWPDPFSTKNWS